MPRKITPVNMDHIMRIYAGPGGAEQAAAEAGVSKRTVQRWAALQGVTSGFTPPIKVDCPSAAAYARGCTCDGCKEANKQAQRAIKERRVSEGSVGKRRVPHGSVSGYSNWDCRCDRCRTAWSAYLRERRAIRRMEAAG